MAFLTFFLMLGVLLWLGAAMGGRNGIVPTLLGLLLLGQFFLALLDQSVHGRDRGIGAAFVPFIIFVSGMIALAGAGMFLWGMSRLTPKGRKVVLAGLFAGLPLTGFGVFLWWSHANIADVTASAEKIAGNTPYCIAVPFGHTYRQAATLADFSGASMRAPLESGMYGGPHATLAVGSGNRPETYHWSYGMKSFVKDSYLGDGPIYCLPRPHFARTMPNRRGAQSQADEFRMDGMRFSVPAGYRVLASGDGEPFITFYATPPDFTPAPEASAPGSNYSEVTVYFSDTDSPYMGLAAKIPKSNGSAYGLEKSTGRYASLYFNVSSDKRLGTLIDCSAGPQDPRKYCMHAFRRDGWTYVFYHAPGDVPEWKAMEDKLVTLTRAFVRPAAADAPAP